MITEYQNLAQFASLSLLAEENFSVDLFDPGGLCPLDFLLLNGRKLNYNQQSI